MRIAVPGGGHGAYAAAAEMSELGHDVRLWRRDRAAFAPVLDTGAITVTDHRGTRAVEIACPTLSLRPSAIEVSLCFPGPRFPEPSC